MPVAGEFAVGAGISLSNFSGFVGDMFNNSTNNNLGSSLYQYNPATWDNSISGKYMLTDNTALRMSFYNYGEDYTNVYDVYDDRSNDPDSMVTDTYRANDSWTSLSVGYEWRRGKSRLRGFYGVDGAIAWSGGGSEHYEYGNQMTSSNMAPTSAWGNNTRRTLSINYSSEFMIGARGFVGVEYFVAPKISIGTEFGWGVWYGNSGTETEVEEFYDPFANNGEGAVVTDETIYHNGRYFYSEIDNIGGQLYFTFFF